MLQIIDKMNSKKKKWCRQHGMSCKDKDCPYEHLDEAPECCNAILEFPSDENGNSRFCICELDKGHKGNHKALMFEWEEGTTKTGIDTWSRGKNLLQCYIQKIIHL